MRILVTAIASVGCLAVSAQPLPTLPGCEPRPEVRRVLEEKLSDPVLLEMKFADRVALRRQGLEELIAKYPREVEPYRRLIQTTRRDDPDGYPALVERFRRQAEANPRDPVALYVAGLALSGRDTPLSIRLVEQARSQSPDFAWPALELANLYLPGTRRADPKRAAEEIEAFFAACPASTEPEAQRTLDRGGTRELQLRVSAAVRERLSTETSPQRLRGYETLWGLEFRTHPPQEHDAVRKQVAADVKRLESLNSHPDAGWLAFLKNGVKQSGAPAEALRAAEDRVIQAFPRSDEAYRVVREQWEKAHPEPESDSDSAGWTRYHAEFRKALEGWIARFTEARELQHTEWFDATRFDPGAAGEKELRALEDYLAYVRAYRQPALSSYLAAADFLLEQNLEPRRVFDLLRDWDHLMDQWHARMLGDNLTAESEDLWSSNETILRQVAAGRILVAARRAEDPTAAKVVKPFVERDLPAKTWPSIESMYWWNRARLRALEKSDADALTYYQKALHIRKGPPPAFEGRTVDPLMDEARALWKRMGGTEAAWTLWSKPPAPRVQETLESGWKTPSKAMPPFELADLAGKTWSLKNLAGKAVLINVWATWCGPCQAELPHLQRLYEKVKGRDDLQILTLTIDEDLGLVAPFVKEKGYTFPVLPAFGFVTRLLDLVGIPQNWIVDGKGQWRWTGAPSVPDAEWEGAMLKQLESAR